jgi:Trypsin-like peptidase domain
MAGISSPRTTNVVKDENLDTILPGVVMIVALDGNSNISRVGSGVIVDRERGLIATAAHLLFEMDDGPSFGKLCDGKIIVGVMLEGERSATFRYYAQLESFGDLRSTDVCILRMYARFEEDIEDVISFATDIPVRPEKGEGSMCPENLTALPLGQEKLEESVRVIGFHQCENGMALNKNGVFCRAVNVARGYVRKHFSRKDCARVRRNLIFDAKDEIVIGDCRTYPGHSGGPCVNNSDEVIGILSRGFNDHEGSFVVPSSEIDALLKSCVNCSLSETN